MKEYKHAIELPTEWDHFVAGNIYLSRHILQEMENVSKYAPRYYMHYNENRLTACFVLFEKRHNLFTLRKWVNMPLKIKFIYLLLSANASGIKFTEDIGQQLNNIRGLKIILNAKEAEHLTSFSRAVYLPSITLANRWNTMTEYLNSLRSNYRYRYNKARQRGKEINKRLLVNNAEFTEEMYKLYEQVYNNSKYKLEKLELDFFRNNFSKIIVLEIAGQPQAFVQLIESKDKLIFEFGGFNYIINNRYDLYINMLLTIVEYGIENKFKLIDFGQTAEDAKMKLGCFLENRYALIGHSNRLINYIVKKGINLVGYQQDKYNFNVFRTQAEK